MAKGQAFVWFWIFFTLLPHQALAKSFRPKEFKEKLASEPPANEYYTAENILSHKKTEKLTGQTELSDALRKKANTLFNAAKILSKNSPGILLEDFEREVRFYEMVKPAVAKMMKASTSVYIHPGKDGIIKYPIQAYKNGHVYIHLKKADPRLKKGGYKSFSRSLDYETGRAYANLVTHITSQKHSNVILGELKHMRDMKDASSVLTFRDAAAYVGYDKSHVLRNKIAFQAELYEGDLSDFRTVYAEKPELVYEAAGQAAKAVRDLHRLGKFHRDIKPSNFLLRFVGGRIEVIVADLGLAHQKGQEAFGHHLAGTRGYIAPELCVASVEKGWAAETWEEAVKADIYALGLTFLSLMEGRHNPLHDAIVQVNGIGLSKAKVAQPLVSLQSAVKTWEQQHRLFGVQFDTRVSGADQAKRQNFLKLAWQMCDPDPNARPTMERVIANLSN